MPPSSSMAKPPPPSTSTNPNPAPAPPKAAVSPNQQVLLSKIRRHLQHDPVVRGGVSDPQDFKSIKEYWSSRRNKVVESFVPRGVPRRPPPAQSHMLSNSAQSFIRKLVQIQYDMDQADICLTSIGPDTFVVDEFTGTPLISCAAFKDVAPVTSPEREMDANMSSVADIVDFDVIGGDNSMPLEVSDGLLPMMRTEGHDMLYAILNHPSLVPIENRMDLNLRLYQQLFSVVERMSKSDWEQVLRRLIFPSNWHTQVKANRCSMKHPNAQRQRGRRRVARRSLAHGVRLAGHDYNCARCCQRPDEFVTSTRHQRAVASATEPDLRPTNGGEWQMFTVKQCALIYDAAKVSHGYPYVWVKQVPVIGKQASIRVNEASKNSEGANCLVLMAILSSWVHGSSWGHILSNNALCHLVQSELER